MNIKQYRVLQHHKKIKAQAHNVLGFFLLRLLKGV